MRYGERVARRHLEASVPEPVLRERLSPAYTMGCKRVLISNDYYPALLRDDVELVPEPIEEVVPEGIRTADGRMREVDAIVFGTGFRLTDSLSRIRVFGLAGRELRESWRDGVEVYYGMCVSGFPNFFMLNGPNTALGHNSIIFMIEAQVHYVSKCLEMVRRRRLRWLDVLPSAQRAFNEGLRARMADAVWSSRPQVAPDAERRQHGTADVGRLGHGRDRFPGLRPSGEPQTSRDYEADTALHR